jgi:hypothetical protein
LLLPSFPVAMSISQLLCTSFSVALSISFICFSHLFHLILAYLLEFSYFSLSCTSGLSHLTLVPLFVAFIHLHWFLHLFQLFLALFRIYSLTSFRFVLLLFQLLLAYISFASPTTFSWIPPLSQLLLESLPIAYRSSLTYFSHLSLLLLPSLSVASSTSRIVPRTVFSCFHTSLSCLQRLFHLILCHISILFSIWLEDFSYIASLLLHSLQLLLALF